MAGAFHEQNKRQYMRRIALGLCRACGKEKPARGRVLGKKCLKRKLGWYYENKEHALEAQRKYKTKLRERAFAAYGGPVCACCGEDRDEFLTIDHEKNDGAEHRRQIGTSGTIFQWLKKNNYPPGFRVLCMNCNFSYGVRGYCPHEKERMNERAG